MQLQPRKVAVSGALDALLVFLLQKPWEQGLPFKYFRGD